MQGLPLFVENLETWTSRGNLYTVWEKSARKQNVSVGLIVSCEKTSWSST